MKNHNRIRQKHTVELLSFKVWSNKLWMLCIMEFDDIITFIFELCIKSIKSQFRRVYNNAIYR
jgi:hypothetical protein